MAYLHERRQPGMPRMTLALPNQTLEQHHHHHTHTQDASVFSDQQGQHQHQRPLAMQDSTRSNLGPMSAPPVAYSAMQHHMQLLPLSPPGGGGGGGAANLYSPISASIIPDASAGHNPFFPDLPQFQKQHHHLYQDPGTPHHHQQHSQQQQQQHHHQHQHRHQPPAFHQQQQYPHQQPSHEQQQHPHEQHQPQHPTQPLSDLDSISSSSQLDHPQVYTFKTEQSSSQSFGHAGSGSGPDPRRGSVISVVKNEPGVSGGASNSHSEENDIEVEQDVGGLDILGTASAAEPSEHDGSSPSPPPGATIFVDETDNMHFINATVESVKEQIIREETTPKKKRVRTTATQLAILQQAFMADPMPSAAVRASVAERLGMTSRSVQVWFQNKRAKLKLDQKRGSVGGLLERSAFIDANEGLRRSRTLSAEQGAMLRERLQAFRDENDDQAVDVATSNGADGSTPPFVMSSNDSASQHLLGSKDTMHSVAPSNISIITPEASPNRHYSIAATDTIPEEPQQPPHQVTLGHQRLPPHTQVYNNQSNTILSNKPAMSGPVRRRPSLASAAKGLKPLVTRIRSSDNLNVFAHLARTNSADQHPYLGGSASARHHSLPDIHQPQQQPGSAPADCNNHQQLSPHLPSPSYPSPAASHVSLSQYLCRHNLSNCSECLAELQGVSVPVSPARSNPPSPSFASARRPSLLRSSNAHPAALHSQPYFVNGANSTATNGINARTGTTNNTPLLKPHQHHPYFPNRMVSRRHSLFEPPTSLPGWSGRPYLSQNSHLSGIPDVAVEQDDTFSAGPSVQASGQFPLQHVDLDYHQQQQQQQQHQQDDHHSHPQQQQQGTQPHFETLSTTGRTHRASFSSSATVISDSDLPIRPPSVIPDQLQQPPPPPQQGHYHQDLSTHVDMSFNPADMPSDQKPATHLGFGGIQQDQMDAFQQQPYTAWEATNPDMTLTSDDLTHGYPGPDGATATHNTASDLPLDPELLQSTTHEFELLHLGEQYMQQQPQSQPQLGQLDPGYQFGGMSGTTGSESLPLNGHQQPSQTGLVEQQQIQHQHQHQHQQQQQQQRMPLQHFDPSFPVSPVPNPPHYSLPFNPTTQNYYPNQFQQPLPVHQLTTLQRRNHRQQPWRRRSMSTPDIFMYPPPATPSPLTQQQHHNSSRPNQTGSEPYAYPLNPAPTTPNENITLNHSHHHQQQQHLDIPTDYSQLHPLT